MDLSLTIALIYPTSTTIPAIYTYTTYMIFFSYSVEIKPRLRSTTLPYLFLIGGLVNLKSIRYHIRNKILIKLITYLLLRLTSPLIQLGLAIAIILGMIEFSTKLADIYLIPKDIIYYILHILLYPLFSFLFLTTLNIYNKKPRINILLAFYNYWINFTQIFKTFAFPLLLYLIFELLLLAIKSFYPDITNNVISHINNYTIYGNLFRIAYMILIYIPSSVMYIIYTKKSEKYFHNSPDNTLAPS